MAVMGQKWVEMKTDRVETGRFDAAPAVLNHLTFIYVCDCRAE
jgi:hypothetical protein